MEDALPNYRVKADYGFSSLVATEGNEKVNYMHVMANGCRLDGLQKIIEQHMEVTSKEDILLEWGDRDVRYTGRIQAVDYDILLGYGACPTFDGGEGHNVEVRTPLMAEDKISPIVAQEMRKYEDEMTHHIAGIEHCIQER